MEGGDGARFDIHQSSGVCTRGRKNHLRAQTTRSGTPSAGWPGKVANEAVQGDTGWSSFEAKEATSKISYDRRLRLMDQCRWAQEAVRIHTYDFYAEPLPKAPLPAGEKVRLFRRTGRGDHRKRM